jgi:hypothetical protein
MVGTSPDAFASGAFAHPTVRPYCFSIPASAISFSHTTS